MSDYDIGYDNAIMGLDRLTDDELITKNIDSVSYNDGYNEALSDIDYYYVYEGVFGD